MSSAINHAKRSHRSHMMHYSGAKNMKRTYAPRVSGTYGDGGLFGRLIRAFGRRGKQDNGDGEG